MLLCQNRCGETITMELERSMLSVAPAAAGKESNSPRPPERTTRRYSSTKTGGRSGRHLAQGSTTSSKVAALFEAANSGDKAALEALLHAKVVDIEARDKVKLFMFWVRWGVWSWV